MKVFPDSINLRKSDESIEDGFFQESINLQWRDGGNKPIPDRLASAIDVEGFSKIIAHKVGDENTINILGFGSDKDLYWIGTITDGIYASISPDPILDLSASQDLDQVSFTILNGIIRMMSAEDGYEFYSSLQYDESSSAYVAKDLYEWKGIYPIFKEKSNLAGLIGSVYYPCGVSLMRYTLVLKSGEEVMHSPIYPFSYMSSISTTTPPSTGDLLEDIHSFVEIGLEYTTSELITIRDNFTGINVYFTTPDYYTDYSTPISRISNEQIATTIRAKSKDLFYLAAQYNIENVIDGNNEQLVLTIGDFNAAYLSSVGRIDANTIAAGSVMPIDNFSHHKLYGKLTSYNGRVIIEAPKTIMTPGYLKSILTDKIAGSDITDNSNSFESETEDGDVTGDSTSLGAITVDEIYTIGLVSYPDSRANKVYHFYQDGGTPILLPKVYNVTKIDNKNLSLSTSFTVDTASIFTYYNILVIEAPPSSSYADSDGTYNSNNRLQFSQAGEFSVFPALNSYRVGEGKIVSTGANRVNPENADVVSPLIIGTTDGVYTLNLDLTGASLINSITKTKNTPFLSSETLEIEGNLIFVSDKGLMAINNGNVENLTKDFFADYGDGNFQVPETIYPNYNSLLKKDTTAFIDPSDYKVSDIVDFMKNAIFAYDGRRDNIWCSNVTEEFSLVYSTTLNKWSVSTYYFEQAIDFFSIIINGGNEYYSRFLTKDPDSFYLDILSGEDETNPVTFHLLTRPIKLGSSDVFKKLNRTFVRCNLLSESDVNCLFSLGVWGKQNVDKYSESIPLAAIQGRETAVPKHYLNGVRNDVPLGRLKGKYKAVTILFSGITYPDSTIDAFDFDIEGVDQSNLR